MRNPRDERLLGVNANGGLEYFSFDSDSDEVTIRTEQQVAPIVSINRELAKDTKGWKGELHRVASIPLNLFHQLEQTGITRDVSAFRKWLNDPDNRFFRTKPGRV